jgi:hypothetical protein
MIYFLALLPATALTIAGYFVLFLSARSEGALRTFGKYLGFWAFTLAGLLILGAVFAAARGGHRCPVFGMHGMHERMHERMHGSWPPTAERPEVGPPAPATAPSPTRAPTPPPPAPR